MSNGWIPASKYPPVIMHKSGRFGHSKAYPVLIEGFKDPMMGQVYQASDGTKIWNGINYAGNREVVYYYDLPAAPSDHEATR